MGLLGDIFKIADGTISTITDIIGITNYHGKQKAREIATQAYMEGKISDREYQELLEYIKLQ